MKLLCTDIAASLKECPFCESEAFATMKINGNSNGEYFLEAEIKCPKCKISMTTASSYFYASDGLTFNEVAILMTKTINRWNTRAKE